MPKKRKGKLSAKKAKKMLHEGTAQGHPITPRQRRYFGAVAGGRSTGPKGKK